MEEEYVKKSPDQEASIEAPPSATKPSFKTQMSQKAQEIERKFRLQPKLIFGLIMMTALLLLVLLPILAMLYRNHMEEQYAKQAYSQASMAARLIDGDKVRNYYYSGEKDAYYDRIDTFVNLTQEEMDLTYFYVIVPEEEDVAYIWDGGDKSQDDIFDLGEREPYYGDDYDIMREAFELGIPQTVLVRNDDEDGYGNLASAYVAVNDSNGNPVGLVCVDMSMEMINSQINYLMWTTFLVTCVVLAASVVAYYFYIRRVLIRPINILHDSVTELVPKNADSLQNFNIDLHTGDEFEELATSFSGMTVELQEYMDNIAKVTAEKERIGAELNVAAKIQSDMLPCIFPAFPGHNEFDIYATMTPAKAVGGDFYDFFLVDDDHLALVIADVSGKGVPAALFMVIAKTLLKNSAQTGLSPKKVLEKVNNQLCENNEAEMFVTVWFGLYEISTGKLKAANAGHEYPALRRAGGQFELVKDRHGFVLAGMENVRYREYELVLEPGDTLFVYTDGVAEATNAQEELYGTERMLAALNEDPNASPQTLLAEVKKSIDAFVQDAPQFDDITMLCMERLNGLNDGQTEGTTPQDNSKIPSEEDK